MHSCANFWAKLGSYAVLSRISILADLRVFCANFGSEKMGLCYFLHFLHVCAQSGASVAPGTLGGAFTQTIYCPSPVPLSFGFSPGDWPAFDAYIVVNDYSVLMGHSGQIGNMRHSGTLKTQNSQYA